MDKRWHNPMKSLPDTRGGEVSGMTARVIVEVILSDGTQEVVQFRRVRANEGGAFCGFKDTDMSREHLGIGSDYNEYWTEFIPYGETWYLGSRIGAPARTVKKWRYIQPEVTHA